MRSPEVTSFETVVEIAYAESTGVIFVSIGPVVPELKNGCKGGGRIVLSYQGGSGHGGQRSRGIFIFLH